MNPCYADWVDNSVAKLAKSFEKILFREIFFEIVIYFYSDSASDIVGLWDDY